MKLVLAGLNHRTSPLEVRERLAVTSQGLPQALATLAGHLDQGVILSTCNRTEFYTMAGGVDQVWTGIQGFAAEYFGLTLSEFAKNFYLREHTDAARHLFQVSCGLDSMILGESQILGQVRDAFSTSVAARTVHHPLSRVFHQAIRVGKRARRETRIGSHGLSISRASVELAQRVVGELRGRRVLVIGAGEAGKLAARALSRYGVRELFITNRTLARAEELARDLGGITVPFEEMEEALESCHIVISSTDSPEVVLGRPMVEKALSRRTEPLFLLDIAVPRDIDPSVAEVPGAFLFDVDDLEAVAETNRGEREKEAEKVEAIVEEEIGRFVGWWENLKIVPTIASLREQAEALRKRELSRALRRLPNLREEERAVLEGLSRALIKKLLHNPVAILKEQRRQDHIQAVRELFHLEEPHHGGP